MYQRQYQKLQPQTTAHLAQTMSLLSMNNAELNQEVERILNENPALDRANEVRCPQCKRKLAEGQICPVCSNPKNQSPEESIVFLSPRSDFQGSGKSTMDEDFIPDEFVTEDENLPAYILNQIALDLDDRDRTIAAYLLTIMDDDGFILENDVSIAQYFHVPISRVTEVRNLIKRSDPVGVGSNTPEEALMVQFDVINEKSALPKFYRSIIEGELETLAKKDYKAIAKKFEISEKKVKDVEEFILNNLNPYPGRASWGRSSENKSFTRDVYTKPDIIVNYLNNDPVQALSVEIILPYYGFLEVNAIYKSAMKSSEEEKKNELKPDYDKATLFIKCLQQRNNTMRLLLEKITKYQGEFIRKGEKYITPLTRASLAEEMDVHESTISRAVSNKSLQLPDGKIIPLSKFFDRSLGIRAELKEIIQQEDKKKPLSDTKLAEALHDRGYDIARRTIAKYRAMEEILPAYMRKKSKDDRA